MYEVFLLRNNAGVLFQKISFLHQATGFVELRSDYVIDKNIGQLTMFKKAGNCFPAKSIY